jgi:uncharacterized membrane protein YkoI
MINNTGRLITAFAVGPVGTVGGARAGDEPNGERQQKISLDQVPAPVKATIQQESAGGQITEISQETERGQATYEVKIAKDGQRSKLYVAPDGTVLKRGGSEDDDDDD